MIRGWAERVWRARGARSRRGGKGERSGWGPRIWEGRAKRWVKRRRVTRSKRLWTMRSRSR
eukprot:5315601-Pyramimonas_sp.AAC.1